jgi:sugar lactone lactonase YvrE
MIADSRLGAVFRVDTDTGISEIAFSDVALNAIANATVPIGINGLKVFGGYVYFTNTARNTFGRVPISDAGENIGDIEIVATLNPTDAGYDWDDFVFDKNGTAYIAQPSNAIAAISPGGNQTILVGGGNSTAIVGPTSVTLGLDQKTAYITTRGGAVGNFTYSGQVVEVELE